MEYVALIILVALLLAAVVPRGKAKGDEGIATHVVDKLKDVDRRRRRPAEQG